MKNRIPALQDERIIHYFLEPIRNVQYEKITGVYYTDAFQKGELSNDEKNIHIISHELEIQFSNNKSLFISWNSEKGWEQYVLGCSNHSFFDDYPNRYSMFDKMRVIACPYKIS